MNLAGWGNAIEQFGALTFIHNDAICRITCSSDAATVVSFITANVARSKHVGRPCSCVSTGARQPSASLKRSSGLADDGGSLESMHQRRMPKGWLPSGRRDNTWRLGAAGLNKMPLVLPEDRRHKGKVQAVRP